MRFSPEFIGELKARLRLSDVIGRTVKLRRQGREYVGLSPFNKERSPSFFVNDDKGFFHDFSSGKHGDLIGWLQETERLSFREAVRLAAEAGLALPAADPRAAAEEAQRATLHDWMEQAATWFEAQLRRPPGAAARAYLAKRGLPEAEWPVARLGYAPGGRSMRISSSGSIEGRRSACRSRQGAPARPPGRRSGRWRGAGDPGKMPLQAELVEERALIHPTLTHHGRLSLTTRESAPHPAFNGLFQRNPPEADAGIEPQQRTFKRSVAPFCPEPRCAP